MLIDATSTRCCCCVEILIDFHFHFVNFSFVFEMSIRVIQRSIDVTKNKQKYFYSLLNATQRVCDEVWWISIRHGTLMADDRVNQWCLHRTSISFKILLTRKITDHLWPDDRFLLLSFHYNLCAWTIHAFKRYLYVASIMLFKMWVKR